MTRLIDAFEALRSSDQLAKLVGTLVLLTVLLLIRWIAKRVIARRTADLDTRLLWRQIVSYVLFLGGLVFVAWIWFDGIGTLLAAFSLIAAALTIVNKEFILNLTAWTVIVWRGLFAIGDRVEIGGQTGIVIDMGPLYVTLAQTLRESDKDQVTGRQVKVPNGLVLTQPVINETGASQVTWNELTLALTQKSNWRHAAAVVERVLQEETDRFKEQGPVVGKMEVLLDGRAYTPQVYVDVEEGKIVITARYACPTLERRLSRSRVWQQLLTAFREVEDVKLC